MIRRDEDLIAAAIVALAVGLLFLGLWTSGCLP
jgi:hypothetical protein